MSGLRRWGESAGAVSIAMHLLTNNGNNEGLFRAAFMQSGAPVAVGDITHGQPFFDQFVKDTGCSGAKDVLECLRSVSEEDFQAAADKSPPIIGFRVRHESTCRRCFMD